MNGVTHYTVGTAVALLTTNTLIQVNQWITNTLPQPLTGLLTPPQSLLQANAAANALHNLESIATANGIDPTSIISNTDVSSLLQASGIVAQDVGTLTFNWLIIAAIGALSGLLPDIDHGGSTISNLGKHAKKFVFEVFHLHWLLKLALIIFFGTINLITQTLSFIARLFGGHRGPIHTAFVMILLSVPIGWITGNFFAIPFYGLIFGLGYLSHLLIDTPNPTGIMWLWPLTNKYYHLGIPKILWFYSENSLANLIITLIGAISMGVQVWWLTDSGILAVAVIAIPTALQLAAIWAGQKFKHIYNGSHAYSAH